MKRCTLAAAAFAVMALATSMHTVAQSAPSSAGPTYSREVASILFKNCTGCHRPGEIGPMSLLTYKDVRPWAKAIATRVSAGTMPPWHADPSTGVFLNDRRLSDADRNTILQWVEAGAPEGNPADLPEPPKYTDGWMIGKPDVVLSMQEDYPISARGTIAYQYFEVPTNFNEDRWVQAWEVRPSNRAVVHHVIVYTRPREAAPQPEGAAPRAQQGRRPAPVFTFADGMNIPAGQTGGPELPPDQRKPLGPNDRPAPKRLGPSIGAYVPGTSTRVYPLNTATRLAAGSTLVFQMHYTTTGEATTDRTSIGLIFAKEPPQTELRGTALINGALHIPAGDPDYRVDAEMTMNRDVTLWGMLPHTHVRGKRWSYEVTYPDGRKETILAVPRYDFEWQTDYLFKQPLKLPKGTTLHATAWYDNSPGNKSNPDASKDVWWGDQTWEEMMFTGLTYSVDPATPARTSAGGQ
jgi:mono/diheme cytochrome c family protein